MFGIDSGSETEGILAVDFGSTWIKGACVARNGRILEEVSRPAIEGRVTGVGGFELDPALLREAFRRVNEELLGRLSARQRIRGIFLSSEMHGALLADSRGEALTAYMSWKDERSREPVDGTSTIDWLDSKLGRMEFRRLTGMRLRSGIALASVAHLMRGRMLPAGARRVATLGDWLAGVSGGSPLGSHLSLLGSTGFVDIRSGTIPAAIGTFLEDLQEGELLIGPPLAEVREVSRYRSDAGLEIPIFSPVGDMIAAIAGAEAADSGSTVYLNLGTGSQVVAIRDRYAPELDDPALEIRNYLDGKYLSAVTHIPAGRALNVYAERVPDFWGLLGSLSSDEILDARDLEVNLAVFASAWNFKGDPVPTPVPARMSARRFSANLLRSWAAQYLDALRLVDPGGKARRIQLSGGIPQKLPSIQAAFAELTVREVRPASAITETLSGLARIGAGYFGWPISA
ncbi:MAG: FGGY family carbohydrate kinase [Oligoflexia bacterium]|nr:FGGY family carbohydrate kinase [Oligoflexia bacterium]